MKLVLKNKTEYNVADVSTENSIIFVLDTFAEIDNIKPKLTEDNFKGATLGENRLEYVVPQTLEVKANLADETYVLTVACHKKNDVEILKEQMGEVQDAIAELAEV